MKPNPYGKYERQRTAVEGGFNIIGRPAVASVRAAFFVDLGQGAFDKSGGSADDGNDPHPENRSEAAQADGR